jgi:hypothetical protein
LNLTQRHHMPQVIDMELHDLMFVMLGFTLAMSPFLPFGAEMFTLCHCILEV